MAFYENTIVAKQDLAEKELKTIKEKYNELINKSFTPYDPVMSEKLLKSSKLSSYDLKKLDIELGELISTNILSLINQNYKNKSYTCKEKFFIKKYF